MCEREKEARSDVEEQMRLRAYDRDGIRTGSDFSLEKESMTYPLLFVSPAQFHASTYSRSPHTLHSFSNGLLVNVRKHLGLPSTLQLLWSAFYFLYLVIRLSSFIHHTAPTLLARARHNSAGPAIHVTILNSDIEYISPVNPP